MDKSLKKNLYYFNFKKDQLELANIVVKIVIVFFIDSSDLPNFICVIFFDNLHCQIT